VLTWDQAWWLLSSGELTAARSFRFLTELLTGFVNLINGYKVWGRSLERPQFVYLFQSERTHTWH